MFYIVFIGNVYITDGGNYRIRKVTVSTGIITTIVGTGTGGFSGDGGSATSASIAGPFQITIDSAGRNALINTNILY